MLNRSELELELRSMFDGIFLSMHKIMRDFKMSEKLTRQQKRELGILPVQVLAHCKNADLTKYMYAREMAFAYSAYISDQQEFAVCWNGIEDGTYGADWDAILEFLTKLFEMLIKFLPLFI